MSQTLEQKCDGVAVAQIQEAAERRIPFRWKFHSVSELRKALQEYTAMIDLMLATKMGKPPAGGEDPNPDDMDTMYRIMAQNKEIDRRMLRLSEEAPLFHRLLDVYYRHGMSCEAEGWRIAAKRCGLRCALRVRRGKDVSRPQFELVHDLAVSELFFCR